MRIGYACLVVGVPGTDFRTCTAQNANEDHLRGLIGHNLQSLEQAIDYNISQGIGLFRITSGLIPFGSSPLNRLDWSAAFSDSFTRIGGKIKACGMRVSMHPGQYTVLNSPNSEVVERAAADLAYHVLVLDSLGLDASHKVILHLGGRYQDKAEALARFARNWQLLDGSIRSRLVIENDDRIFTIGDTLGIGMHLGIPVVFDHLHHRLNHGEDSPPDPVWIERCRPTWTDGDGRQKIHYSQQNPDRKGGSHSASISLRSFLVYCSDLDRDDLDIMLEVKDKNLSARKCSLALEENPRRQDLENEWARYKYAVLEHAPADYVAIRQLLNDRSRVPVLEFYDLLEHALAQAATPGNAENAALHVWGYFKQLATEPEKAAFLRTMDGYRSGAVSLAKVKNRLNALAIHYSQEYLRQSLYFYLQGPS